MNYLISSYFLNIISLLGPSIIVLYLYNIKNKNKLLENVSLFFIITLLIVSLNLGFLNFVIRARIISFLSYGISSFFFGIPLTLYLVETFNEKIDLKNKISIKVKDAISIIIMFLSVIVLSYSLYYFYFYTCKDFDSTLFTFLSPIVGTSIESYIHGLTYCFPMILIFCLLFMIPITDRTKKVMLTFKKKKIQLLPIKFFVRYKILYSIVIFILVLCYSIYNFYVPKYINSLSSNNFYLYERYFVDAKNVKINFPKKKKNLIFIMAESLESTLISKENGGYFKESIIPELERLAKDNVNFSFNDSLGGFATPRSCSWTIAGTLCQTSGIPLKMTLENIFSNTLIPKATSLWNILDANGYNLKVVMGTNSTFAKTRAFFNDHKVSDIVDYEEILKRENLPTNYKEWWGVEDRILFKRAKEEIKDIAKQGKPFATLISTMDTHFPDGYQDKKCQRRQKDNYLQSYNCSSNMIGEFIDWVKKQDFYEDTVIVVVGDHLSMQKNTFSHVKDDDRFVYNVFINTGFSNLRTKNRKFTSFDIYPTLLYSVGGEIEGNRLGFGTNLFSNRKTLAEEIGFKKFIDESYIHSPYYKRFDK